VQYHEDAMPRSASTPATVNVSEIIDDASIESFHVGLFALCALCMVMDGFDVYALGYVAPTIIQEWRVSPALLGPVFSVLASNANPALSRASEIETVSKSIGTNVRFDGIATAATLNRSFFHPCVIG
jgi:hypothetical protein